MFSDLQPASPLTPSPPLPSPVEHGKAAGVCPTPGRGRQRGLDGSQGAMPIVLLPPHPSFIGPTNLCLCSCQVLEVLWILAHESNVPQEIVSVSFPRMVDADSPRASDQPPPLPLSSPGRSQVACQDSRLQLHQRQGARARGVFPAPRAVGGVVSVRTLLILHPPHPTPLRPLQKWMVACIGDLRKGTWTVPALQHLRSISELFISDTRRYPYTSPTKSRQEVCCGL